MDIDIVILWVDGSDEKWLAERAKYMTNREKDAGANRYRDWGTLKYIFRGIEKFAPWVRNVFLVTCGQCPTWLDTDHPKVRLIRHSDFLKPENLPTFSSQAIDLNLWRIPELSEHFIYLNDDMFFTDHVKPDDFFKNGLPRDVFSERPAFPGNIVYNTNLLNNMQVLYKYYPRRSTLRALRTKVLNPKYGLLFFYNLMWYIMPFKKFCGLYMNHLPMSFLKSNMQKVWERDPEFFEETSAHRFRNNSDVNQFVYNIDNLLSGNFYPTNMDTQGKIYTVTDTNVDQVCTAIKKSRHKRLCINDECTEEVFEQVQPLILESFECLFPEKSTYEL
jgi:hypothetical protein